jgi:hypothetical protein
VERLICVAWSPNKKGRRRPGRDKGSVFGAVDPPPIDDDLRTCTRDLGGESGENEV